MYNQPVDFPGCQFPYIYIEKVENFWVDGSSGMLEFIGADGRVTEERLPCTLKMRTREIEPKPYLIVRRENGEIIRTLTHVRNTHIYTVVLELHEKVRDIFVEGEWDEEEGGYIVFTPMSQQRVWFRVICEESVKKRDYDIIEYH